MRESPALGDVNLSQESLVDASGVDASGFYNGSIQIAGRRLQLRDGSLALIQNQGPFSTGDLTVNASESLYLGGIEPTGSVFSGFWLETFGLGGGGEITIAAPQLTLQSSAQIFSSTFGAAEASNINIFTNESLQVIGPQTGEIGAAFISSLSAGSGKSGNIAISTKQLNITNGGFILTANITPFTPGTISGNSGNIEINAKDFVRVDGIALDLTNPSAISAATFSNGLAGNVTVNTSKLIVSNGGRVDSSTPALGTAGSVTINASDSIQVSGVPPGSGEPSLVSSAATTLDQNLRDALRVFEDPTGVSGKLLINTRQLTVAEEGQISVRNDGIKEAGDLEINADSINLDTQGSITATAASEQGGNILLNAENLQLRHNSPITASAQGGSGRGGNITINTGTLAALENSDITADALGGPGGRVTINTQAIFGTQFRDRLTPESDITATGQSSFNGIVQINIPTEVNFVRASAPPVTPRQTPVVTSVCPSTSGSTTSSLVNTGTGGMPPSYTDLLVENNGWYDNFPSQANGNLQKVETSTNAKPVQMIERRAGYGVLTELSA